MTYKYLIFWNLLFCCISCQNQTSNPIEESKLIQQKNFYEGIWRWKSENKQEEFTLKIYFANEDSLFGQYCAVYNGGQKLDCDFDSIINVKGIYNKNKAAYIVVFHSFFNSGKGFALIKKNVDNLIWKISNIPNGEYYAPLECELHRIKQ